jgi:hypothetical protein
MMAAMMRNMFGAILKFHCDITTKSALAISLHEDNLILIDQKYCRQQLGINGEMPWVWGEEAVFEQIWQGLQS